MQEHWRILITGGHGFVGRHLIAKLRQRPSGDQHDILVIGQGQERSMDPQWNVRQVNLDIRDHATLAQLVADFRPTHVVHLAAVSGIPTAQDDVFLTWGINAMGTLGILESLRRHAPQAKIVLVSSSEVYGKSFGQGIPLDESAPLNPLNTYAATKAATEMMSIQFQAMYGLPIIRVRPFNHVGPGQAPNFVASDFAFQVARIERGERPPVIHVGNLSAIRDFSDVRDIVEGYLLILEQFNQLPPAAVYNLCSGQGRSIQSILDDMLQFTKVNIEVRTDPNKIRRIEIPAAVGSRAAMERDLGWRGTIPWQQTLMDVLNDARQQLSNPYRDDS